MKRHTKHVFMFLATWAAICLVSAPGYSQTTRGTITGTVSDESGAIVAGVRITVTQIDQGLTWDTTTDTSGNYVVPSLFPGRYRVEAEMKGFQKTVIEPLQLHVDERLAVNPVLKVGAISQEIKVTSQGSMVETATSAIGQVVGSKAMVDLPLNGRNFLQLAYFSPGTASTPAGTDSLGRGSISISGSRTQSNQFSIDGVFNGATAYNDLNVMASVDSIQEYKIQRNTFNAEFGYGTAQINVATKSGGNKFHGSAYEFIRNDVLDARQFFDVSIPPFRQNQFGASLGGPLRKDKTFFFANYEGFRWRRSITQIGTLPTAQMLSGDFSGTAAVIDPATLGTTEGPTSFADNQIPADRISPLSARIRAYLPEVTTAGAANYVTSPAYSQDWDQMTLRIDHRLSSRDSIFGRYTFYPSMKTYNPGLVPLTGNIVKNAPHNATVQWVHSFSPTLLNEFRVGFNREFFSDLQEGAYGTDILQQQNRDQDPIAYGLPIVSMLGYSAFGSPATDPQSRGSNVYAYSDSLTWIHGSHTLKFGGSFRNAQQPHVPTVFNLGYYVFQGYASGNAVADFLLGNPFIAIGAGRRPTAYMGWHMYEGFLQDDWKVTSRFTLNFGVRYEQVGATTDRYRGRMGYFNEATGEVVSGTANVEAAGLINPDNLGFQPRFGFSWQPFSQPHTVVRGGFGVYNDVKVINERNFSLGTEMGWQQIVDIYPLLGLAPSVTWDNLFPTVSGEGGLGILSDDPFSRDPYVQMWSLGIQRELPGDAVLEVDYVGQVGHKLSTRIDINQARLPDAEGTPLAERRPYPSMGSIVMSKDIADSNYNALQVRFEKRYSHNLSFLAAYGWSKSLDTASSTCDQSSCNSAQDNRNIAADYGRSSFDQRHRLVMGPMYMLPFGKGQKYLSHLSGAANKLVSGWQVNSIITFSAGTPFTVQVTGADRQEVGTMSGGLQRANCVGVGQLPNSERTILRDFNTDAFEVAPLGTHGNCGRNILTSRGTNNWDFSLLKNTSITESTTLQFRAEFFNAFNHPQFGTPIYDPTNQAFGQITSVRSAREIQFALKLLF